jgi:zinc finger SWIM domain-containing protein 3
VVVPEVGMSFQYENDAYQMYNTYAGNNGFSVRKSDIKQCADKSISSKVIICSKQGSSSTMTDYGARIQFSVTREGLLTVKNLVSDHNHHLASPNNKCKLRSQRQVIDADRQLIAQIREAGMRPSQVYEFMKQFYDGAKNIPFSRTDCNNEFGMMFSFYRHNRWTKYATRGFYIDKKRNENENLKSYAPCLL